MSDFGVWESVETSDSEKKIASRRSEDKLAAAIYDVKDKYGEFLYASTAIDEFHDRVALVKTDMMKTVDQHLMPVTGVMRRVIKACKDEWRTRTAAPGTEASGGTPGGSTSGGGGWSSGPGGFDAQPNPDLGAMYNSTLNSNQTPASIGQMMSPGLPGAADATNQAGGGMGPVSETAPVNGYAGQTRTPNIIGAGRNRRRADNTGPAMDLEETFEPSSGNLVPEGNFDGYLAEVEQGAPEKAEENFISAGRHDIDDIWDRGRSDVSFVNVDPGHGIYRNHPGPLDGVDGYDANEDDTFVPADYLGPAKYHGPQGGEGRHHAARLAFSVYKDYCETNGLRVASIDSLDRYAENLSDAQYFQLASIIERIAAQPSPGTDGASGGEGRVNSPTLPSSSPAPGWGGALQQGGVADWQPGTGAFQQNMIAPGQIAASRRRQAGDMKRHDDGWHKCELCGHEIDPDGNGHYENEHDPEDRCRAKRASARRQAAGSGKTNYLQKADEALTQVLESKAEEFQETIAPLQQALQVIQQAEQAEQAANPMGVQPPPGTVNVLPGQDPSMGGGDPSMGGGDPSMGGDPMAGGGGDLAQALGLAGAQGMPTPGPEGAQQQITGHKVAKGYGRKCPECKSVNTDYSPWSNDYDCYDCGANFKPYSNSKKKPKKESSSSGGRQDGGAYPFVRKGGILDQYNSWLKKRKDLPRGGEADYWAFARENGFGQGEVDSLKKHFQTAAAKVSLSDGEMGSYPRTSGVRGQRSGASPVGGSNRSSSTRESNPSRQGASAGGRKARLSNRNTGNPRASDDSLSGGSGVSWSQTGEARGTASQRSGSRQSSGEPGVWDQGSEHAGHGRSRHAVVPEENSMSRRASAGRAESSGFPVEAGLEVMQGVSGRTQMGQASSWDGGSDRSRSVLSENNVRKLAWSGFGFGPSSFQPKVAGWIWDSHLNGYIANAANKFACNCGESFEVPSYHNCKCGKIYNSYVIGTGGDNHTASIEKYICREIQVRPDVIVANRKAKRHKVTDPGALGDGEEDDLPTMKPVPQDWRRRNEHGQFSAKRR